LPAPVIWIIDPITLNRIMISFLYLSMLFSENLYLSMIFSEIRFPFFRIMR